MRAAQDIKTLARGFGADLCGIGHIERWDGAPAIERPTAPNRRPEEDYA